MNRLMTLLICLNCFLFAENPQNFTLIQDLSDLPEIKTPIFSSQKTMKIRLSNGLEAYLISDPNIDQSLAVLRVATGNWEDPDTAPGTAHFLEHMLFLGSKKYPLESEYLQFIGEHGGKRNAFTSTNTTAYFFSIDNPAFSEGLDRLAHFFIDPLFTPSGVSREVQAIDQEYFQNIEKDGYRSFYVFKELTNPSHPIHAFSSGNKDSLSNISQDALKEWYHNHYSANRMQLVVASILPLDSLKNLVINTFSQIPNHDLKAPDVDAPMIPDHIKGHMVYVEPIKHIRKLTISWELPPHFSEMSDSQPERLIAYVLGDEGKKSLLENLKNKKLADGIHVYLEKLGKHSSLFVIDISLTDIGVKNVDAVIEKTFGAIATFKKKGIPKYIYHQFQQMATIAYQYQDRENAFSRAQHLAEMLSHEEFVTYPARSLFIPRFDPKEIMEFLNFLTPENGLYFLIAPMSLTGIKMVHKERFVGAEYSVEPISTKLLTLWHKIESDLSIDLPAQNPYIPGNMSTLKITKATESKIPRPKTIIDDNLAKIYFAKDQFYLAPQVILSFEIKTPSIQSNSAESLVMADLS